LAIDLQPGDEVVMPDFTFTSTATAVVMAGGTPVFADVSPDTLNLDPDSVANAIGPRTRAIIAVNYAGVACDFVALGDIAQKHGLVLIEDNAHGLGGTDHGQPLGTMSRFSCLSFHETKNISCGEGGAIVIADPADVEAVEILREKGTNRAAFFRGSVAKYNWVGRGSSYLLAEPLVAYLLPQLERLDEITARRRAIWERYAIELAGWAAQYGVGLPTVPDGCEQPGHLFYVLLSDLERREELRTHLGANGILAPFHYQSLSAAPAGQRYGRTPAVPTVSRSVADRMLRLPLFYDLTDAQQGEVIDSVIAYVGS